ncbi:hypothetical protein C8P68_103165 [Mucilaginibacter yixingensis]|uniref:Lipoprotein n=1 Tax=Mucilaginibacter yixingensis TaxID=1295612 RepID=A0A2T5JAX0_9SPHI|nr:hypothetical protein [Mucilaginibacter yixingensis]PTQ98006.1 hypothetical protein C8P68_103165 [Mucilaginibacter yixingensis]
MKKLFFIPFAATLLLSACQTYQLNTMSSVNAAIDDKTGKFNVENDSVKITYSFSGKNAPINVAVYNKLNEPIYVDWKRSAYIIDKKAVSFSDRAVKVNGTFDAATSRSTGASYTSGSLQATANLPENIMFIPPHAQVDKTLLEMAPEQNRFIEDSLVTKVQINDQLTAEPFNARMAKFNKNNSPLFFKSYITMYTINNNIQKFMTYTNEFYVSETVESAHGPESFSWFKPQRGDTFYSNIKSQWGSAGAN